MIHIIWFVTKHFQLKCRWGKDDHKTFDMAGGLQNLKLDSSSSTVQMNQIYPIPVQSYQPYQPYSQPYIVSNDYFFYYDYKF